MRYYAKIEGSDHEIELNVDEDGNVAIAGREVDLVPLGANRYSLILDGCSYELYAQPVSDTLGHTAYVVSSGQSRLRVAVQSERERRIRKAAPLANAAGEVSIKAPMPGLVTAISVAVGVHVQANQRLLLLEAMKMENEIRAPRPGIVKSISIIPGDKVGQGQILITLELSLRPSGRGLG